MQKRLPARVMAAMSRPQPHLLEPIIVGGLWRSSGYRFTLVQEFESGSNAAGFYCNLDLLLGRYEVLRPTQ
jgi:hypothetical protein